MGIIEDTLKFVIDSHNDQKDKSGNPYILHVIRVASEFHNEDEIITALLHDVVEDTNITLNQLKKKGYNRNIIKAVDCLTRKINETYEDYIKRISHNKLAVKVKLADLLDNANIMRYKKLDKKNVNRLIKYINAYNLLINLNKLK